MKYKTMLIIAVILLMTLRVKSFEYPDKATDKWLKMNDQQQYELFVAMCKQYDNLLIQYNRLKAISDSQDRRIDLLLSQIKILNNDKFKYGFSWGLNAGIDNKLLVSIDIQCNLYIIFLKRFFISPSFSVVFYQNIGGKIGFNFGFLW